IDHHKYLNRILKPAQNGRGSKASTSNPCAGPLARSSVRNQRSQATQTHLKHADSGITHYQKAIPETIKSAALALDSELNCAGSERVDVIEGPSKSLEIWSWRRDLNPRPSDYKSECPIPTVNCVVALSTSCKGRFSVLSTEND